MRNLPIIPHTAPAPAPAAALGAAVPLLGAGAAPSAAPGAAPAAGGAGAGPSLLPPPPLLPHLVNKVAAVVSRTPPLRRPTPDTDNQSIKQVGNQSEIM